MKFRLGRRKPKNVQAVLRGWRAYLHLLMLGGAIAMHVVPARADLPVPCGGGSCGGQVWVAAGRVQAPVIAGDTMRITQESDKAILNWASFNIGRGQQVQFAQPSSAAIALNRIHQQDPSRIEGRLSANGQVYLINQNGIVFGGGAQVNVNSLTASTLDVDDKVFADTGLARVLQVQGDAAFKARGAMGAIRIEQGAELKSADGGRIMILAPVIDNAGDIETPNGQAVLAAAKDKVYLATSDDPNLRGLLVEVAGGGELTNSGSVAAPHGNVSLLGFAINQNGVVSASTTVRVNGSIRLLAREVTNVTTQNGQPVLTTRSERDGTSSKVTFGANSVTEVLPDLADKITAVDEQPQQRSTVDVTAKQIRLGENALIHAPSGVVAITATKSPDQPQPAANATPRNDSRIELAPGSRIDVAGTTSTAVPMERNQVQVELRANELSDAPLQRDGVLRGEKVVVDVRKGTRLGDISGAVANIQRDIGERSSRGGDVSLTSEGDLILRQGAVVDVSGGTVRYRDGYINTTKLLAQGKWIDIGDADPNARYDAVLGQYSRTDPKWGVKQSWTVPGVQTQGMFEPGYVAGAPAGTINLKSSALRLDGELRGGVQSGPYQRDAAHLPAGGSLAIDLVSLGQAGLAYPAATVRFASGPALTEDEAQRGLDPSATVLLSPEMLQRGGLSALTLKSAGIVDLPAGTALRLPAGGHLSLSGDVRLSGAIDIPAGSVTVDGTHIVLNDGAHIDVRGRWVNDNPLLSDKRPSDALLIDGGVVALSARGDLLLRSGSVIDAGGGAWADGKGRLHEGRGGNISLKTDFPGGSKLEMGAELRAYAPHEGGVLDITANSVRIDRPGAPPPSQPDPNELVLTPDFFQRGGFRSYRLNANLNSITLAGGTEVVPRMQNLEFDRDYAQRPNGSELIQFTHTVTLPDYERAPVDMSLSLHRTAAVGVNAGRFEMQKGGVIRTDPGATVTLTSDASLIVNGRIEAPAGGIDLAVTPPADDGNEPGYLAGQGIWLGPRAQLLAPSQLKSIPDDRGLRRGELLSGGHVSLNAQRGFIVSAAGSVIDVSGGETQLDVESVPGESAPSLAPSRKRVIAPAGSITLNAAEGMLLDGDLRGHAPADAYAGDLQITLDSAGRSEPDTPPAAPARDFLYGPRRIELRAGGTPSIPNGVQQGAAIADVYNGRALIDAHLIQQGGFEAVLLRSRNVFRPGVTTPAATGEIAFDDGVDLQLARELRLDAPALRGEGNVHLAAAYMTLGNSNFASQEGATASAGGGNLQVDAAQAMEIIGALGLRGFGEVRLNSGGDLRLTGVQVGGTANELTGALNANGLLTLQAEQIYSSTLSRYRIEVGGNDSRLVTLHSGGPDMPVLSAGSDLTLHAVHIEHGGVLKAPMGAIHLRAGDDLRLLPASKVSVSAEDQDILFGVTQFGVDWLYGLRDGNVLFGTTADPKQNRRALPEKRIDLNGRAVSLEAGATLDVSGGGDLLAYEFIPGPGGSRDVLAANNAGSSFAVLPRLNNALAPYDPMASAGFSASPGATVHLTEGSAVPAGDYTILPARYALLPGAYLVTPVANTQNIQPGMPATRADNTPIVAGYYTSAGTGVRGNGRWQGFVVEASDVINQRSEYKISEASQFFADASSAATRLPQDAGRVQIQTTDSLLLAGQLRAATGSGGRGSALDISAADISIVPTPDPADQDGVQIAAAGLNQLNAESLLIGGRRSADGGDIAVDARAVRMTAGAELQGREIVLAATQRLTLDSGARIDANGAETSDGDPLHVSGDSAVLRASSGPQRELSRTGSLSGRAMLDIEAGARVTAGGSLLLDSSGDAALDGEIAMQGGSLAIGAAHINLGDAPQGQSGVVLRQALLDGLHVDELTLRSSDGIDVYGNLSVNARRLAFDAAGLYGRNNTGASVLLKADEVQLGNGYHAAAPDLNAAGDARLVVDSQRLSMSGGDFALQGFGEIQANAARELYFGSDGHTRIDGDLDLNVGGISAAAGADASLDAQGALRIAALSNGGNVTPPGLGARLEFNAERIEHHGEIVLPAGEVTMNGRDGVALAAGSLIDVSGTVKRYADQAVAAPAGRVTLASAEGDVVLAPGARLGMRAAPDGDAGELRLSAPSGAVQLAGDIDAHAKAGRRGGRVSVDAGRLDDFSALNRTLDRAGFSDGRELRVREGDVNIAADDIVRAKDISLTADGGGIDVRGALIGEADKSRIALYGRDDVTLEPGALLRAASGHVELGTTQGRISLNGGAHIDVAAQDGSAAGGVHLRAPRVDSDGDGADDDVAVDAIRADVTGAGQLTVEAFRRYDADVVFDNGVYRGDAEQYMTQASAIEARLGANAQVQPGVELASEGNLTLLSDWDLASWRYEDRPGVLTLRAAGNLYVGANLSDGFDLNAGVDARTGEAIDALRSDASWSYRLVGGADLASADPLATEHTGDVTVGEGMRVRTGTGTIDVAAGSNVVLADGGSTLYTAGLSTGIGTFPADYLSFLMPGEYPTRGGDVHIAAGGDVRGAPPTQFITDWLHRMGGIDTGAGDIPTVWSIDFERYHMGIGTLGGGDVSIQAGGAVSDLAVMLPTTGQHRGDALVDANGNLRFTDDSMVIQGGGDLAIDAGGDIRGGVFYLGRGEGEIRSGGALASDSAAKLYPVLALADAEYKVTSRGDLNLETAVNPTLLRQGVEQDTLGGLLQSNFFSYGVDSGVTLTALSGDIHLRNDTAALSESSMPSLSQAAAREPWSATVYPGSLRAQALQGDIEVNNSFTLFPSARGTLELLAEGNVSGVSALGSVTVNLSDTDPAQLPGVARPSASLQDALTRLSALGDAAKIHAATPVHQQDDTPARIVAANGNIAGDPSSGQFALYLSKPVLVSAGGDVRDVSLNTQNLRATDVSVVQAGRDIRFNIARNGQGQLVNKQLHLQTAGPGRLDVLAGRDIDLGTSDGIVTIGNGLNPALPTGGADVVVQAGVPLDANYDGFVSRYLINGADYRSLLADYMQTRKVDPGASDLDAFIALPRDQQRALVMEIFFRELQASGRKAANSGNSDDYQRGYDAIATLYPPGNAHGDLRMYFSRIHTVAGGSIYAGVPAGLIDAGVAAAVGFTKSTDQLGIVSLQNGSVDVYVDEDMLVNQSRVFAMDGGDILIWSSHGNIDAGRGAKSALAAPSSKTDYDQNGNAITTFPPTVSGSGIRAFVSTPGRAPGDVDLFAPVGVVNAGDAGIGSAGNVTIGAVQVLGADNIDVGGIAVGVPLGDTSALGGALASLGDAVSSATKNVEETAKAAGEQKTATPVADAALHFLEVEVTGFGDQDKDKKKRDAGSK